LSTTGDPAVFEVYAIRYARSLRKRSESFIGGDLHDGPMPMAYYIWLIRNQSTAIVVDTGFDETVATKRNREFLISPVEGLRALAVEHGQVSHVILTHLHYDHAGNHPLFPNAIFHLQADEMRYSTGPNMRHKTLRAGYDSADVKAVIDRLYSDRLVFHDGAAEIVPGVNVLRMGGHSAGLQAVTVLTQRGLIVLASDSAVFYEGLETGRAFPAAFHVGEELDGYETLLNLAGSIRNIVPGHDVAVMERYPSVVEDVAWRLDVEPTA
jgi:glyoxylase-like metal-dependent hydrolase (beta-lactamase superfamily II)